MEKFLETRNRNVIPRWRDFRSTVELGELGTGMPARSIDPIDISDIVDAWSNNHGLSFAGDLISAAIVSGVPEVAREASEFVLENADAAFISLRLLASQVLGRPGGQRIGLLPESSLTTPEGSRKPSVAIAKARNELSARPRNAILWMDLAYLFASRGLPDKAEKSIRVALQLAPSNRFILRSAARFYIHQDRLNDAHQLIRRSSATKFDPWLLSAEIAISMAAENVTFFAKEGQSLLASGRFSNHHVSELASALGTLEAAHGSNRRAKKHLRNSLIAATDNSLAQATWLSQKVGGLSLEITEREYEVARPFEANVYRSFAIREWEDSFRSSLRWLRDQPFSGRAARTATYLANTIFLKHSVAEELAKIGQIANPTDPHFFISLAYSYARRDRLDEAEAELKKVPSSEVEDWIPTAVEANYGLLAYRRGRLGEGRARYAEAVRKADQLSDKGTKILALTNWAFEEMKHSREQAQKLLLDAEESAKKASGPEIPFLIARAQQELESFSVDKGQILTAQLSPGLDP